MNQHEDQKPRKTHFKLGILFFLIILSINCQGQAALTENTTNSICINGRDTILLTSLGKTTIFLKSGGHKSKCTIRNIGAMTIEYLKDGSLHDLSIGKIDRIVSEKNIGMVIYFDADNKPIIGSRASMLIQEQELFQPTEKQKENSHRGNDLMILKNGDSVFCTIQRQSSMYVFYFEDNVSKTRSKSEISRIIPSGVPEDNTIDDPTADTELPTEDTIVSEQRINIEKEKKNILSDTIQLRSGEILFAKVNEIGMSSITYTNINGEKNSIDRSKVKKVSLSNGYKQEFKEELDIEGSNKIDYYQMGKYDGERYFNAGPAVATGALSSILLYFGLIIVGLVALCPPINLYNPSNPNNKLLSTNDEYERGYRKGAHRKKARKVFKGFFVGLLAIVIFALLLVAITF